MGIKTILHILYWSFVFSEGIFQLLQIQANYNKLLVGITLVLLFFERILQLRERITFPYFHRFIALLLIIVLTGIGNEISYFAILYFVFYMFAGYFYYIIIINENSLLLINKIISCLKIIFIIQLLAAGIKLMFIGISEKGGIGTMSTGAGALSALFPMMSIAIVLPYSLDSFNKKVVALIVLFFGFGIVGDKRAIAFSIPILVLFMYFINVLYTKRNTSKEIFKLVVMIPIAFLILYLTIRFLPTLNPDNTVFGRFDLEYFIQYVTDYNSSQGVELKEIRRFGSIPYFYGYLYNVGIPNFLFGEGAGHLISSRFSTDFDNPMLSTYGVRYGGGMTMIYLLLQIGFIGMVIYMSFIVSLMRNALKSSQTRIYTITLWGLLFTYAFDFFIYSNVFFKYLPLNGIFYFILALSHKSGSISLLNRN